MQVRVASWNLRGIRRGVDAVAAEIKDLSPDVLLLQETGSRGRLAALGRELDFRVAADPPAPLRRRVKDAVLVRKPWAVDAARLHRFPGSVFFYPRGALAADLGLGPVRVRAISAHLGLRQVERVAHARELLRLVDAFDGPVVVGGDLNARPHQDAPMMLGERLRDVWLSEVSAGHTFPARDPVARIDYVYVTGQVEVRDADVVRTKASDHLPVVADLEL